MVDTEQAVQNEMATRCGQNWWNVFTTADERATKLCYRLEHIRCSAKLINNLDYTTHELRLAAFNFNLEDSIDRMRVCEQLASRNPQMKEQTLNPETVIFR